MNFALTDEQMLLREAEPTISAQIGVNPQAEEAMAIVRQAQGALEPLMGDYARIIHEGPLPPGVGPAMMGDCLFDRSGADGSPSSGGPPAFRPASGVSSFF